VETSGNVTYVSKYIWRGFDLGPADEDAMQGWVTVNWSSGLSASAWGSYSLDSDAQIDELDYTVGYSARLSEAVSMSAGYTHYTFPSVVSAAEAQTESEEFYAGLSFPKAFMSPSLTVYEDTDAGNGTYIYLSGGTEFTVGEEKPQPVAFKLGVGYNNGQWAPVSGVTNIDAGLSSTFKSGSVDITPSLNYVINTEDLVNTDNEFWFGIGMNFGL
jgi:hypothetical protein